MTDTREVYNSRELLHNLTLRELRGKYKGTALGWLWSLINPLATTAIFTIVFSTVMRVDPPVGVNGLHNYSLFLLCGLLTWNFMAGAFQTGMGSLVANGNLIKKTYFPRRLLVISNVAAAFVSYAIEMLVLIAIFLAFRVNVLPYIPLILLVMVLLGFFALALALMLSVVNVYFRDIAHFVTLFMQLWFYATPIIYPITLIEGTRDNGKWTAAWHVADLYTLNPMVGFVESIRDMMYSGRLPGWQPIVYCLVITAVLLWIGNRVFGRMEKRLAEEL
ncbi:ABC transporter permease [Cellulomonas sp. P22]|uniref:ABC transporter permease n=1 Tax=Cellulomonas sp. P22 TaxID=3373189 RepID=UPI00378C6DEB